MPLRMLADLDEKVEKILDFRRILADAPASLQRAESAYVAFKRTRDKILEEAPKFHELRGVVAGLELAAPSILDEKVLVRAEFDAGRIDKPTAERRLESLTSAGRKIQKAQEERKVELQKQAGRVDGIYWAASESLVELSGILRHYAEGKSRGEDEDDWSGRGTENGQRPLPPAGVEGNGARKAARRRGTTTRTPIGSDSEG